ncbi:MAG: TRAP transporter small permease [Hyphomicrobiaceae bacterium]
MADNGAEAPSEARPAAIVRLSRAIALMGGLVAICIASVVVASVLGRWLFNAPINGDFELVQMGTAVSVFMFLPFCQARRGNIVVDTFTSWLSPRTTQVIDAFWDLVYAGAMGLMSVALITGGLEHLRNGQTTMMLQLIIWPALCICAILCAVLAVVAFATAVTLLRGQE